MPCPNEAQLIRLVAGELEAGSADEIRRHAAQCPGCTAALAELEATWQVMGAATADTPGSDLWPAIQASVGLEAKPSPSWLPRTRPALLRAAASLVVAVGLGWMTGSWVARPAGGGAEQIPPSQEELIESLGLDEFASISATGLSEALLSADEEPAEEES
jgi:anti-sigma factor RsiW